MATKPILLSVRTLDWLAVAVLAAASIFAIAGGASVPKQTESAPNEISAVRVEIQRYIGYEILPARYLSLPYDLTMNINEQVAFLDTGALLLIFAPILVLLGLRQKPALQLLVIVSCIFLLIISLSNSYISGPNFEIVRSEQAALSQYLGATSFSQAPTGVISATVYQFFLAMYSPVQSFFNQVSGDRDAITYPLLLLIFGLFFFVSTRRFQHRALPEQSLLSFTFVYLFFWLMLSSGIVWYGILIFPLLTALIFWSLTNRLPNADLPEKLTRYGFFTLVAAFVVMGFAQRFSNIKLSILNTDALVGKRLYDPAFLKYQAGDIPTVAVTEAFYPGLSKALEVMNREPNSLIFNVGTRFNFFIRENDTRIFRDNQLDLFQQLQAKYPYKEKITAMLKNAGFGYIMVDFNTPTGDNTPEQTLVERFKKFMLLLYENPALELLATNRIIKSNINGSEQLVYGVFGEVQSPGSYAIFRIK
jgi:hypothetical protein